MLKPHTQMIMLSTKLSFNRSSAKIRRRLMLSTEIFAIYIPFCLIWKKIKFDSTGIQNGRESRVFFLIASSAFLGINPLDRTKAYSLTEKHLF